MWPFRRQRIVLEYNGDSYMLGRNVFPGLKGSGIIEITNKDGYQRQSSSGSFYGRLEQSQVNGKCFINGVDVGALVNKLDSADCV